MLADSITVNYKTNRYSFPSLGENQLHQQQPTVIVCLCVYFFLCRKSAPSWILFESVILQNKIIVHPKSKVDIPDSNFGKPRMN